MKEFFAKIFAAILSAFKKPAKVEPPPVVKPVESIPVEDTKIIAPKTIDEYTRKYAQAKVKVNHLGEVGRICLKIRAHKDLYDNVHKYTGVPWWAVAAIHSLEGGLDFGTCLHNGERIIGTGEVTTLVPAGRGPFATWDEAAIDALGGHGKHFDKKSWGIGEWLNWLESFNGRGYARRNLDSPYLWSYTTEQRTTGKYIKDGVFDPKAVSKQCGAVAIIKTLLL
jgi:lysozyme family protein